MEVGEKYQASGFLQEELTRFSKMEGSYITQGLFPLHLEGWKLH